MLAVGVGSFPNNGVAEFETVEKLPVPIRLTAATRKT
jgi:hypothetical protein